VPPKDLPSLGTQPADHEFTEQELFEVFRRLVPDSQARLMARAGTRLDEVARTSDSSPRHPPAESGVAFTPEPTIDLTEDTLVLLSLLSEETARKVERYRRAARGGLDATQEEERRWEQRRSVLKAWADAGFPREP
jgi:hypothetical protein